MNTAHLLSLACASLALLAPTPNAQCAGQGDLTFEVVALDATAGLSEGAPILLRITGKPDEHICLACDIGDGPTDLFGLGVACLDFGPGFVEFVFTLPPTGVAEIMTTVPVGLPVDSICCLALGLDPAAPNSLAISNNVCFDIGPPCDGGGLAGLGTVARLEDVTTFPVTVQVRATGRAGGGGTESVSVSYDPSSPPTFPIESGNGLAIAKIARDGDDLLVWSNVTADAGGLSHNQAGRLPNEVRFTVSADGASTTEQIHTSCSVPIAVGFVFGDYTITSVTLHKQPDWTAMPATFAARANK